MKMQIMDHVGKQIDYLSTRFSGGERHIQLLKISERKPLSLSVKACLQSADDIMELLLLENALRQAFGRSVPLCLELPYLPYSRQDRVCAAGQAFSLEVMAQLLQPMHIERLVTWDCHSDVGIKLTGAINVPPADIIQSDPYLSHLLQQPNAVLVCPDQGATTRCQGIVESFGLKHMVHCNKQRDPSTGKILKTEVLTGDLEGRCAIITDDLCDGGYTFIKIAEQLRAKHAERIVLFVTHGIFSKGLTVFEGLIDEVITTNSLPQQAHSALRVINYTYTGAQS